MEQQQNEQGQPLRIEEPVFKLTTQLMKTCNPKNLDKKFLKDFKIKPSETLVNLNNTKLDPQSPKTSKALQDLNIFPNQLELQDKLEYKKNGESQELTEKRYWLHYFQVAQLKKAVILQRNKYKREEWIEKQQRPKSIQTLDQSMNSSINISEYVPYKSPTEMIESWIDSQVQSSDRQLQKFNKLQQKRKELEEQTQEEQEKYKEKLEIIQEKKKKNRLNNLKQKSQIARKDVSKSLEVSTKMKTVIQEEKYKNAQLKKLQTEQNIEKAQKRVDQIKQTYVDVLEEKQKIYEEKLHQVLRKKDEQDQQLMQQRLQDIQTERTNKSIKKIRKSNEWSTKLPLLISRSEAQFKNVYNSNLASVIEKFQKEEKKKLKLHKSQEIEKEQVEEIKQKEEQFKKRYSDKLKQFENKRQKIEEKFAQKDQYLVEHLQKKKEELEEKFEKIRELSAENEKRFVNIKQQYNNKCDKQMDKEQKKFKQNMSLIKQREQIIEQLRYKRFLEKNKPLTLSQDTTSKQSDSKLQL
ncbi:unnamed protein product [Paramecium primaurelia]|uniref:Uncharacterized protein n=1 Tax=Paramecium primaurelia TaxID=5886 RepID=A0A8S1KEZ2_PARPR|nr:unnamed protein product [Paramecium primaurelia]